ncbi:MAG: protein arginine kinase activator [Kiritimatiellia bacterium]|jgi:protein arginine kinase activator
MICEKCKKDEATVHLTQVVGGEVKKLHLCESCAKDSGVDTKSGSSITDLFLGSGEPSGAAVSVGVEQDVVALVCTHCNLTRVDFKKGGRLGCMHCYEVFREELEPLIRAMHHADRHMGKRPSRLSKSVQVEDELYTLQEELALAVASEKFEDAARLRDEVRKLQEKLSAIKAAGAKEAGAKEAAVETSVEDEDEDGASA